MNKQGKSEIIDALHEKFANSSASVLVHYSGMSTSQVNEIRRKCHELGVTYQVIKNRLAKRAAQGTETELFSSKFKGPSAIIIGYKDEIAPAKAVVKFVKEFELLKLVGGSLNGKLLTDKEVIQLSKMPGRNELRGQLLGLFNAVPGGFVRLLNAVPAGLLNVLEARKRQLEEGQN